MNNLAKLKAEDLANVYNRIIKVYEAALRSIAGNTCCASCTEAASVAKSALVRVDVITKGGAT